jgi:hypothetical protein
MMQYDAEGAYSYIRTFSNPGEYRTAFRRLALIEAEGQPQSAVERVLSESTSAYDRDTVAQCAARSAAQKNPVEALNWAQTLKEPITRDVVICSIAETWVGKSPAEAVEAAVNLTDPR